MSPSTRKDLLINGLRPSPLKISKDSHLIQKPGAAPAQPKRQGPVIIYTHSPKIIHTQARDFMALVQKLTGFSRSDEVNETEPSRRRKNNKANDKEGKIDMKLGAKRQEDNDSSSALTDEIGGFSIDGGDVNNVSSSYVPMTVSPANPFFADIPLFTPNSTDFFCSPKPAYKFPDMENLNSPSLLEFIKGLPDY
ncbi:hypothetical protein PTKIN_Ptkin17bG0065400 [Pterospermum kingtungense]